MDTIGDRLRYLRELLSLTQAQVAEKMKVSAQAVTAWERNRSDLSQTSLLTFHKVTGCDLHWLLTGEGIRGELMNVGKNGIFGLHPDNSKTGRFAPMLEPDEIVRLKSESLEEILSKREGQLVYYKTQFPCGPKSFWHEIRNNANSPKFTQGDRVNLDPNEPPKPGDFILAFDEDTNILYFGEYVEINLREFKINKLNPRFAPVLSSEHHLSIRGVMTEQSIPRRP